MINVFQTLPVLGTLAMKNTELHHKFKQYRRKFTATCLKLSNLDGRPITDNDRLYAIAWMKGGKEAEFAERRRVKQLEEEKRWEALQKNEKIREEYAKKTEENRK